MDCTPYAHSTLESSIKFLATRKLILEAQLDEIYRMKAFQMRDFNSEIRALKANLVALKNEKELAYDHTAELETEVKDIELYIDRTNDELKSHYSDKNRWFTKAQGGIFLKHNKNKTLPKHHFINQSHGDLAAIESKIKDKKRELHRLYQEKNSLIATIKLNRKKIVNLKINIGSLNEQVNTLKTTSRIRDTKFRDRHTILNLDKKTASLTEIRDWVDAQLLQFKKDEEILKGQFRQRVEDLIGRL